MAKRFMTNKNFEVFLQRLEEGMAYTGSDGFGRIQRARILIALGIANLMSPHLIALAHYLARTGRAVNVRHLHSLIVKEVEKLPITKPSKRYMTAAVSTPWESGWVSLLSWLHRTGSGDPHIARELRQMIIDEFEVQVSTQELQQIFQEARSLRHGVDDE